MTQQASLALRNTICAADALAAVPNIHHINFHGHLAPVPLHRQRHPLSHPDALELLDQVG